jgi:hypothetical protein
LEPFVNPASRIAGSSRLLFPVILILAVAVAGISAKPGPSPSPRQQARQHPQNSPSRRHPRSAVRPQGPVGDPPQIQIAPFLGNLTAILLPPADGLALLRQSDCSLLFSDFAYSSTGVQFSSTLKSQTPHYDATLHANSFLTTTPGVFPTGCKDNNLGSTSRLVSYLGLGKNGDELIATVTDIGVITFGLQPDGTLTTNVAQDTDIEPASVVSGDLNGDGNPDFVSIDTDGVNSSVDIFLGNADGSYQSGTDIDFPGVVAQFGVLDDLNGDGKLDLLLITGTQFTILLGKGDGTFQTPQTYTPPNDTLSFATLFITADVNGDGKKDIITSQGSVFLGSGDGVTYTPVSQLAFPPVVSASNEFAPGIVAADFNKDGKLDLATDDGDDIRTYQGNGDGTFTPGPAYAAISNRGYLFATDLDGDGNVDLFSGHTGPGIYGGDDYLTNGAYALLGNGDGTFPGAPLLPTPYVGTNLADLKGNGSLDLVATGSVGSDGSTATVFNTQLGQSDGSFKTGPQLTLPSGVGAESWVVGDFNGDHIPDLLFNPNNPNSPGYYLALGNGDGSFQTPTFIPAPSFEAPGDIDVNQAIAGLVAADFNHDGKLDIAYSFTDTSFNTHLITEGIVVQLSNGDGTFQAPQITTTYSSLTPPQVFFGSFIGAVSDVNKDTFPDVFLVLPGAIIGFELQHSVELFVGNGDGTFKPPANITLTDNMQAAEANEGAPIAFADLNGDGNVDLVAGGSSSDGTSPELAIALGNGNGTFQAPSILNLDAFGFAPAPSIADFDGDGKLDVYSGGIFPGNGDGTVQSIDNGDSTVSAPLAIALSVFGASVAADLNGDGKPDLIVGNVVLLNKTGSVVPPPTQAPTTTTLVSSVNPSTPGQSVQFTATVTSTTAGTPTGTATFFDGATSLGPAVNLNAQSQAVFATSSLAAGPHSITAQYSGDTNFAASVSNTVTQTVNAPTKAATSTSLISSLNPSTSGQSVQFTATVTSMAAGTPTGTATFFDGATALSPAVNLGAQSSATLTTSSLSTGAHSITAQYSGDANFNASTSPIVTQQVNASGGPDFSVAADPSSLDVTAGQAGDTVLTVTPINGSTQTVTFSCVTPLPTGTACRFSQRSLTLDGTHSATSELTIRTTGGKAGFGPLPFGRTPRLPAALYALLATAALLCLWLAHASSDARRIPAFMLIAILVAFAAVACSSNPNGKDATPAGRYPIGIQVSASGSSHTAEVLLNVSN